MAQTVHQMAHLAENAVSRRRCRCYNLLFRFVFTYTLHFELCTELQQLQQQQTPLPQHYTADKTLHRGY